MPVFHEIVEFPDSQEAFLVERRDENSDALTRIAVFAQVPSDLWDSLYEINGGVSVGQYFGDSHEATPRPDIQIVKSMYFYSEPVFEVAAVEHEYISWLETFDIDGAEAVVKTLKNGEVI